MGLGYGPDDFPMDGWGSEKEDAMGHFIENCRICRGVTRQCRCPDPNKEQRWTICADCQAKGSVPPPPGMRKFKVTVARQEIVEMDFVVEVNEPKCMVDLPSVFAAKEDALKKAHDAEYPRAGTAEYQVTSIREIK